MGHNQMIHNMSSQLVEHIASQIYANFAFEPTIGQKKIIESLAGWLADADHTRIFILNGYAGTGKTTVIAALVAALRRLRIKPVLMAPTGRAAKVVSRHSGERATTIHRRIYRQRSASSPEEGFGLDFNREKDACFIVDEASMIGTSADPSSPFGSGSLLDDLFRYVRQGTRCRIMFVGDAAQLPPVGHDRSPALDPDFMAGFGEVVYGTLDEVMRQDSGSGIMFNATMIRCMLDAGIIEPPLFEMSYPDFAAIDGGEFLEKVEDCYARYGREETIVITRSNKRANRFNEGIRRHVLYAEEEIESGDMLMVVKNNYHFAIGGDGDAAEEADAARRGGDFIANGDTARIERLRRWEEFYGFRFVDARLSFPDYDDREVECKLILDTLASEAPALTREQSNALFQAVSEDYAHIRSKVKRYKEVRENPHFNALQVKFAYAVTAHKAQGGEWQAVFVDKMLFGDEVMNRDLMRWLYTAITRASRQVYLVNFDERFIG